MCRCNIIFMQDVIAFEILKIPNRKLNTVYRKLCNI